MPTPEKLEVVAQLREMITDHSCALLANYRGLRVTEINAVRRQLREAGAKFRVVKNRLFRLALADTEASGLADMVDGPTAVTFTDEPVGTAKALSQATSEYEALAIVGGLVEGELLDAGAIAALARLPTRPELLAEVAAALNSPLAGLVYTLQGIISDLVYTLQAVTEQRAEAEAA